jgi:hypothetical protein
MQASESKEPSALCQLGLVQAIDTIKRLPAAPYKTYSSATRFSSSHHAPNVTNPATYRPYRNFKFPIIMSDERHNISSVPFISRGPGPLRSIHRDFPPAAQSPASNNTRNGSSSPHFEPSVADVVVLRRMFKVPRIFLPIELVDAIIDHAEYWPHSTTEADYTEEHQRPLNVMGSTPTENKFLFRCPPVGWVKPARSNELSYERHESRPLPLSTECTRDFFEKNVKNVHPDLEFPVRKIVFTIKSHDQGWASGGPGTKGGYHDSWTWFEAGLERFDQQECEDTRGYVSAAYCVLLFELTRTTGSRDCAYDVSAPQDVFEPHALPICALRSLYPPVVISEPTAAPGGDSPTASYKLKHDLHPDKHHLVQINKRATSGTTEHRVMWSHLDTSSAKVDNAAAPIDYTSDEGRSSPASRGEFVRKLKLGDVVTLWAKARFGAWRNHVESARVDIYWAI